ncbi:MAG: ATP-binding protein [Lachnospiraceae bacterium]
MKYSISLKLITLYLFLIIVGFAIITLPVTWVVERSTRQQIATEMYNMANHFASSHSFDDGTVDELLPDMSADLDAIHFAMSCDVWIVSPDSTLLYKNGSKSRLTIHSTCDFSATDADNGYYLFGNFYGYFPDKTLSVFAPLHKDYRLCGYIILHMPYSNIVERREANTAYIYALFFIFVILFALIPISFFLWIRHPLKILNQAANEYASGNLNYKISLKNQDEFYTLAQSMSYMANQFAERNEDQYKFIANVSHDFRSPLTSINGYITAMLDGTIPAQLYPKYLNIVLDETSRLTKLTQNLLTLNNLNSRGFYLDYTQFDINHIIKKILATFEGRCSEKGITFDLFFSSREQLVWADMARIQQVLYNLIDNAIKFSNPNSVIEISTYVKNDKVFCSVNDYGVGIPPESLNKIWERFYKTDISRGKDKKGTGLGLSIAKEIIQAHHQTIDVISTQGVGSQFIFTLPLSRPEER